MNPRYRRFLIPGLLVLLLVVVLVSSLADGAKAEESGPVFVSRMTDARIIESSGLALSRSHDGLAYTINDSGNAPIVFAVDVASGRVVGETRVEGGTLQDTEAIAIDREGTLWVSDTGDNAGRRTDVALYALPEPGPGTHTVTAERYPISYEAGPQDVEALLVNPRTGEKFLVSKGLLGGQVFSLPRELATDQVNTATALAGVAPSMVTDGTFAVDGAYAVFRSYTSIFVVDPADWTVLQTFDAPAQDQGESITAEASGRSLLVGSEGASSALIRVPFDAPARPTPSQPAEPTPTAASPTADESQETAPMLYLLGAVGAAVVLGAGVAVVVKRSR